MKLICNGSDLSEAVGKVFKAVNVRTPNPILEGIKLKAEKGSLTITATDYELAIENAIVADVKVEGEAVVPGRFFSEFVKKLNREQIELSLDDSYKLRVRYMDSEGTFQCMPATEYPAIYEMTDAQYFRIQQKEFKDLVNKISFSVSIDDSRPILKGVLLELDDVNVTGVALDGYRMARCSKPIEKTTAMMNAVVPARCLNEIARLLNDTEDLIQINIQKNYMLVDLDHTRITTRLLDGDFVNHKSIVPSGFETVVTIPKEQFEDGLERAMLLSRSDRNNLVYFEISENVMQISSNSEIGNITEKIPVKLTGNDISIAFNARYFSELLRYVDCDNILIKFINSSSPCVVVPSGATEDFMYLILPVKMI